MNTKAKLQTSAKDANSAAAQHKAGFGGSYVVDPATGTTVLSERTDSTKPFSRKAPLTDAKGKVLAPNAFAPAPAPAAQPGDATG